MGKQRYGGYELLTPNAGGLTFDDQYLDRVRLQEDQARAKKKREDELKEYLSQYEDDPYSQAFAEVEFESKQEDAYKAKQQEQEDRIAAEYDDPYDKAFAVAEFLDKQQESPEAKKAFADNERVQQLKQEEKTSRKLDRFGLGNAALRETFGSAIQTVPNLAGVVARAGEGLGLIPEKAADELYRQSGEFGQAREQSREEDMLPYLSRMYGGASQSLLQSAATPGGAASKIIGAGVMSGSEALTTAEDAGLQGTDRLRYAGTQGLLETGIAAIGQKLFGGGVESRLAGQSVAAETWKQLGKNIGTDALKELPEELVTTILQDLSSKYEGVSPDLKFDDFVANSVDTAVQTIMMAGMGNAQNAGKLALRGRPPSDRQPLLDETPPTQPEQQFGLVQPEMEPFAPGERELAPEVPPAVEAFTQKPSATNYDAAVKAGMPPIQRPNRDGRTKYAEDLRKRLAKPPPEPTADPAPPEPAAPMDAQSGNVPDSERELLLSDLFRSETQNVQESNDVQGQLQGSQGNAEAGEDGTRQEGRQEGQQELLDNARAQFEAEYRGIHQKMAELSPTDPDLDAYADRMEELFDSRPEWAREIEGLEQPSPAMNAGDAPPDQPLPPAVDTVSSREAFEREYRAAYDEHDKAPRNSEALREADAKINEITSRNVDWADEIENADPTLTSRWLKKQAPLKPGEQDDSQPDPVAATPEAAPPKYDPVSQRDNHDWSQTFVPREMAKYRAAREAGPEAFTKYLDGRKAPEVYAEIQLVDRTRREKQHRTLIEIGDAKFESHQRKDGDLNNVPDLPYPQDMGRKPAKNSIKPGEIVSVGYLDGSEAFARLEKKNGKRQSFRLLTKATGANERTSPGKLFYVHADDNNLFFGLTNKKEIAGLNPPPLDSGKKEWTDYANRMEATSETQGKPDVPTFEYGDAVTRSDDSGYVGRFEGTDSNGDYIVKKSGKRTTWPKDKTVRSDSAVNYQGNVIPPEKAKAEAQAEPATTRPDLSRGVGQSGDVPGRKGVSYVIHRRKPDVIPDTFKVVVSSPSIGGGGFLSVNGTGMNAEEAYDRAVADFDSKLQERTKTPKAEKPPADSKAPATQETIAKAETPEKTLRGQNLFPGMTGRAEEIDRNEFVRKHQSPLLEHIQDVATNEATRDEMSVPIGKILKGIWNGDLKTPQDLFDTDLGNDLWTALGAAITKDEPRYMHGHLEEEADQAIRRAFAHRDAIKPKVAEKSAEPTESDIKAGVRAELARQLAEEAAAAAAKKPAKTPAVGQGATSKPKAPRKPRTKTGEKLGKLSEDTGVVAKQAWEDFLKGMKGMPLNSALGAFNPQLAKMTVTMVRAQVADKVVKFADLVARIVEYSSPEMARSLSDYLEAAWEILREANSDLDEVGKVADVLGPEKEVTNDKRSERDDSGTDGGRETAGRPLGETPVDETSSEDVSTDAGGRDTGRSGSPSGGRSEGDESETVSDGGEAAGGVSASPARNDRTSGRSGRLDYRIADADQIGVKFNPRERFDKNVEAIKVLKKIESENRRATPDEQKVLAQYVGWGGLKEAFSTREDQGLREKAILKELLTKEELASARTSVRNAHFTSPEVISAMWEGMTDAGFAGGRILEPSMGIGHFYGLVPESVEAVSKLSGIEMDDLTARIAQQLYQTADITHAPYQNVNVKTLQDLVISNVPFGQYKAADKYNKELKHKESIHNFFFLKALTNVRPGGVVAFITSRYTMDTVDPSVREQIAAAGGRFVGAVRLPNNAFMGIAKTKVTTDVIFIQKDAGDAQPWRNTKESAEGFVFSEYFHEHPENVLGKIDPKGGTQIGEWGIAPDGHDIGKELAQKIAAMPFDRAALAENSTEDFETTEDIGEDADVRDGRLSIRGGKLFKAVGGKLEEIVLWGGDRGQDRKFTIIRAMASLAAVRDKLSELETSPLATDAEIERGRKQLNTAYDKFVAQNGFVYKNENQGLFREDEQLPTLLALEEWDTDTKTAKKADVFEKRVQRPDGTATAPTTAEGAAVESYARLGRIDLPMISEWLGKSEAQVESELTGWAYKDPATGDWSLKNVYLSGNIAKKLKDAEAAAKKDPAFQKNADDLRRVLPPRKTAGQIHVRARSPFVKAEQYVQFMQHVGVNGVVRHDDITGAWLIDNPHIEDPVKAGPWGVGKKTAADLLEGLLNNKPPVVWTKDYDGNRVIDQAATQLARAKAQELEDEFGKWIFSDPDRAKQIEDSFNDGVGAYIEGEWDGSHLTLPGMNINITLLPHQLNAVWRAIVTGNIMLAHEVGLGKTFIMAAIAMERKRLGLVTNQMFVVPNHLLSQWASEFKALYPSAKLLALESDQINSTNRRTLMERVKSGRFDAIIVTPEAYKKMPMSNAIVKAKMGEITLKIENTIKEARKAKGDNKNFVAKLESVLESIRGKMEVMLNDPAKDAGAKFDELGIEAIYVDEAHEYRNLWSMTQMGDISGVGLNGNQKTFDMLLKTDYLNEKTNNRGIVFATGTPIANSISELYSMQRYLQPQTLAEAGVASFDDWANTFGEAVTDIEVDPTGSGFRSKTRFKEFRNTIALSKIFRQVADVKYAEDVGLDKVRPKLRGGKLHAIQVMPSMGLLAYVRDLVRRLEISKSRSFDKRIDNPLKVTTDGRKAALDMRLVIPEEDSISSKINHAVENVARIYREEDERKGVQLLWVNLGTPASTKKKKKNDKPKPDSDGPDAQAQMDDEEDALESGRINAYEDIKRKLIAQGIPEHEIAFIHDHDSKDQKRALFQKVRDGKVRILISTVKKLATGANIQDRLAAMHFLDPPWKPADIEQALGRAIRRGNLYKDWGGVQAFTYVTRGSFDAYIWQLLENKAKAIKQIMRGESDSVEDTGRIELNADEVKALASSNPKVLELVKVRNEAGQLRAEFYGYRSELGNVQSEISYRTGVIENRHKALAITEAEIAKLPSRDDLHSNFMVKIGKKEYSKRSEIGAALIAAMPVLDSKDEVKKAKQIKELSSKPVNIGSALGKPIFAGRSDYDGSARIYIGQKDGDYFKPSDDDTGNGVRLFNYFDSKYDEPDNIKRRIASDTQELEALKVRAGQAWPKGERLKAAEDSLKSLEAELGSAAGQKGALPVVSTLTKFAIMAEKLGRKVGRAVTFDGTQWLYGDRLPVDPDEGVTDEMKVEVDNEVALLLSDSNESPQNAFFFNERPKNKLPRGFEVVKDSELRKSAREAAAAVRAIQEENARLTSGIIRELQNRSTGGALLPISKELADLLAKRTLGAIKLQIKQFDVFIKTLRADMSDADINSVKDALIRVWNKAAPIYQLEPSTEFLFNEAMSDATNSDVEQLAEAAIGDDVTPATSPATDAEERDRLYSSQNAFSAAERETLEMGERPEVPTQIREPSIARATAFGQTKYGSDQIDTLIQELGVKPRAVTPYENDLLLFRNTELGEKLETSLRGQIGAKKAGDDAKESIAQQAAGQYRALKKTLIEVLEAIGTAAGRSLQARKAVINQDFTVQRMALEYEAAYGKGPPSTEQLAEFQEEIDALNAKIAELEAMQAESDAKINDLETRLKEAHAEKVSKKKAANTPPAPATAPATAPAATTPIEKTQKEKSREKINDGFKDLSAIRGKVYSIEKAAEDVVKALTKIATGYSELGVITLGEFLKRVGKRMGPDAKELLSELTEAWNRRVRSADGTVDISSVTNKIDANDPETIGRAARDLHSFVIERDNLDGSAAGRNAAVVAVHEILANYVPGITQDQVARAMSGIGIYSELSQDEIEVIRRDQKAQLLLLEQISDWKQGQAPPATGMERPPVSDEQRELRKQVNEAKKDAGIVTATAGQLRSALDAAKRLTQNRINDLTKALKPGGKPIAKSQKLLKTDTELDALRTQRDELQKQYNEAFGKRELSDEQRLNMAEKALDRAIADLESELAAGKLYSDAAKPAITSPAIEAKRAALAALKASRDEMRIQSGEADARSDAAFERHLLEREAVLAQRLADNDFMPAAKKPARELTPSMLKVMMSIQQMRQKLAQKKQKWEFDNSHPIYKAWKKGPVAAGGMLRKGLTGFEQSLIGRQGWLLGITHPLLYGKASRKAFASNMLEAKSIFPTEQDLFNTEAELDADEYWVRMEKIGKLAVTGVHGGMQKTEENMSDVPEWFDKIWGVGGSERAGSAFINTQRRLVFRELVGQLAKMQGKSDTRSLSSADLRVIGNAVNVASGRGSLGGGKWETAMEALSSVFFSPRWWASRVQSLIGAPMWHESRWVGGEGASTEVRLLIAKEWGLQMAAQAGIMTLAVGGLMAAFGDPGEDEEWDWYYDPKSPTFGQIRIGSTYIDMTAGLGQHVSLLGRIYTGKQVDRWETKEIDAWRVLTNYGRGKLAPVPGIIADWVAEESIGQDPFGSTEWAMNKVLPLAAQDVIKTFNEESIPLSAVMTAMMFFGKGGQTREAKVKARKDIANELRAMRKQGKSNELIQSTSKKMQKALDDHLKHTAAIEAKAKLRTADPEDVSKLEAIIAGTTSPELTAAVEKEKFDITLSASEMLSSEDWTKGKAATGDGTIQTARSLLKEIATTKEEAVKLFEAAYRNRHGSLYEKRGGQMVPKKSVSTARRRLRAMYANQGV